MTKQNDLGETFRVLFGLMVVAAIILSGVVLVSYIDNYHERYCAEMTGSEHIVSSESIDNHIQCCYKELEKNTIVEKCDTFKYKEQFRDWVE